MYTILITVLLLSDSTGYAAAVATHSVGVYDNKKVCEDIAKAMFQQSPVDNRRGFIRTAQCVQVKDKP